MVLPPLRPSQFLRSVAISWPRAAESENDVRLAIKLDSPVGRTSGRQAFDVEAPTGTHVDKCWQDQ